MDEKAQRLLDGAREKGVSSWLSALPLKKYGFVLNKQEFQDAIHMRYGWRISSTPKFCACGESNTMDHILYVLKEGIIFIGIIR